MRSKKKSFLWRFSIIEHYAALTGCRNYYNRPTEENIIEQKGFLLFENESSLTIFQSLTGFSSSYDRSQKKCHVISKIYCVDI